MDNIKQKGKNVSLAIMLAVVTLFQLICAVTLIVKGESENRMSIIITFGGYLAAEYAYFIGARLLGRRGFEVELIAFLLTGVGLSITASVYPNLAIKQLIATLIGIAGFVILQIILRDLNLCMRLRYPAAFLAVGLLVFTLIFASVTNGAKIGFTSADCRFSRRSL